MQQCLQGEHTLAQRTLDLAEDNRLIGHELHDTAVLAETGRPLNGRQPVRTDHPLGHEDVARLEVAVDHAGTVGDVDGPRE